MVGRRTSGRCENCRKRKTKCDLAVPACSQCLRRNVKCPGYDLDAMFHAVNPSRSSVQHRKARPPSCLISPTDRLRNEYISNLNHGQLAVRFWLSPSRRGGEFSTLHFIPQRLGESEALDAAVKCVCRPSLNDSDGELARKNYMKALGSLQGALDDNSESLTSGTLAAATLLYIHEIFLHPFEQGWMVHAEGIIKLLEVRGPGRIETDLDRSIVSSQVGTIFLHAVRSRRPCFLAEPEWNVLLRNLTTKASGVSANANEPPSVMSLSVHLPGLLCRYENLPTADTPLAVTALINDIRHVRQELLLWREQNDVQSTDQDFNTELSRALQAPLRLALKLSVLVFLVMTGYMLADLLSRDHSLNYDNLNEQDSSLDNDISDIHEECSQFASSAKMRWLAMTSNDTIAGWAISAPNLMMLRRALKGRCPDNAKLRDLKLLLEDLYNALNGNS